MIRFLTGRGNTHTKTNAAQFKQKIVQLETRIKLLMLEKFALEQEIEELKKVAYPNGVPLNKRK